MLTRSPNLEYRKMNNKVYSDRVKGISYKTGDAHLVHHSHLVPSCPCSPDGKMLVFLSSQAAVDSGAHSATNSLHSMIWPSGVVISPLKIENVVRRGPVTRPCVCQ